jgi:hypothetical protein
VSPNSLNNEIGQNERFVFNLRVYQQYVWASSNPNLLAARGIMAVIRARPIGHIKYLIGGKKEEDQYTAMVTVTNLIWWRVCSMLLPFLKTA